MVIKILARVVYGFEGGKVFPGMLALRINQSYHYIYSIQL